MKFKNILKKEIFIYILTLFVLALIMHIDLLSEPFARFQAMEDKENFTHPFLYAFIVYAVILILRKVIDFIMGLFEKKSDSK